MDKRAYRIVTDYGSYVDYLDEEGVERTRRKYHGFVRIEEYTPFEPVDFDWDKLAEDIYAQTNRP